MERSFPVREVKVVYDCDACRVGEMKCIDQRIQVKIKDGVRTGGYKHKCSVCGEQKLLPKKYPFVTHEQISA